MNYDWTHGNDHYFLVMTVPSSAMQGSQFFFYVKDYKTLLELLIPIILFLLTPYFFAIYFFMRLNRRLNTLNRAMNTVEASSAEITVTDESKDEIGQMTRKFNSMSKRISEQFIQIQELENKRKTMLSNISHDLRTPMTMIQGYAETLHQGLFKNEEEMKEYTEIILRRTRYMNELLEKLFDIVQLESSETQIGKQETDVAEMLRLIAADYILSLESRGFEIEIEIPDHSILARIDENLVERSVRNLVENAYKYGGDGQYLGLKLEESEDQLMIEVVDRGAGVPVEQHRLIFDRFYRGNEGREGEGIGIGLSIVAEVAAAHEGTVELESTPHEETVFRLVLPSV